MPADVHLVKTDTIRNNKLINETQQPLDDGACQESVHVREWDVGPQSSPDSPSDWLQE